MMRRPVRVAIDRIARAPDKRQSDPDLVKSFRYQFDEAKGLGHTPVIDAVWLTDHNRPMLLPGVGLERVMALKQLGYGEIGLTIVADLSYPRFVDQIQDGRYKIIAPVPRSSTSREMDPVRTPCTDLERNFEIRDDYVQRRVDRVLAAEDDLDPRWVALSPTENDATRATAAAKYTPVQPGSQLDRLRNREAMIASEYAAALELLTRIENRRRITEATNYNPASTRRWDQCPQIL